MCILVPRKIVIHKIPIRGTVLMIQLSRKSSTNEYIGQNCVSGNHVMRGLGVVNIAIVSFALTLNDVGFFVS